MVPGKQDRPIFDLLSAENNRKRSLFDLSQIPVTDKFYAIQGRLNTEIQYKVGGLLALESASGGSQRGQGDFPDESASICNGCNEKGFSRYRLFLT